MYLTKPVSFVALLGLLVSGSTHALAGTWVPLGPEGAEVNALGIDPSSPMTIYAATSLGIFRSTEGGGNWEAINVGLTILDARALAIDPANPMNIYAGTFGGGAPRSSNGGDSWQESSLAPKAVQALAIDPDDPMTLYAGTFTSGIFKSSSGGVDWDMVDATRFVLALAIDPGQTTTVYAGTSTGVLKTTDGGDNWQSRNNGITQLDVPALAIDPVNPQTLYAGTFGGGVFKSTDRAASWQAMNNGLPALLPVQALAVSPVDPMTVYAGIRGSGVFQSTDGGATWEAMRDGFTSLDIRSLAIDPVNERVYAGTLRGVFVLPPPSTRWLFAAGDPAGIGGLFDGVALSNYSGLNAGVTLEAISDSTSGKAGLSDQGVSRPLGANQMVDLELPAGEQFADLRENIFPAILKTLPVWIELTSDNSDIASFFQFGSGTLTQLDGGVAIENLATKFFFQRVFDGPAAFRGQDATTRLTVLNPGDEPVTVDLNYFPPGNGPLGLPRQATRKIPSRSFLDEKASDLFGTSISGGYVAGEVTEGGGVAAFELVQLSDRPMVLGLNASMGNSSTRSFSAQLASRSDVFTSINLINTAAGSRNVELTAVRADGGMEGDPVKIILAAGAQFSADASQIFGFGVASAAAAGLQGGAFVGSLEVEADGDGVVGDVIFGDPNDVGFAASLPLQSEPFTEAVFSQFADIPGLFFTGLAFYYPADIGSSPQGGAPDTEITIEVILADGESVGESSFKLLPGERIDKSISDLAPDAAGKANGYILVTSTQPLIAQVVFVALGGGGISLFSAVPPKVIR